MKTYIYILGLMSAFLFSAWITSIFLGLSRHLLFLIPGLIIFFFIYLPLVLIKKRKHKERMRQIVKDYKTKGEDIEISEDSESPTVGWGMNNSPFRDRKSGLSWGGGNIHAANATRGRRKSFRK